MGRQYAERGTRRSDEEEYTAEHTSTAAKAGNAALKTEVDTSEIDALLAEFDETLEENAEQFVEDFQQQGGE